ncbi:MAG: type II toxin-antitoxin system RelE/ParE family toxin [Rhodobacteraceae bacterium]|nr:type II toxin-antitoxin system RelE/ParE family toxin [Paracoccaceae bacterium]
MPRETRFSRRVAERLADIAGWTESTFGPAQADRFRALLLARLGALAAGRVRTPARFRGRPARRATTSL